MRVLSHTQRRVGEFAPSLCAKHHDKYVRDDNDDLVVFVLPTCVHTYMPVYLSKSVKCSFSHAVRLGFITVIVDNNNTKKLRSPSTSTTARNRISLPDGQTDERVLWLLR